MTELSPAAQAVLDAINKELDEAPWDLTFIAGSAAAAVLHAAANQLLAVQWNGQMPVDGAQQIGINWARDALHVLANELEALNFKKPSSLKEQALEALKHAEEGWRPVPADCEIIRRALESLPE